MTIDVAIYPTGEPVVRAGHSLTALHWVGRVALVGRSPSPSWHSPMIRTESVAGFDVVLGEGPKAASAAFEHGLPHVTSASHINGPGIYDANLVGLARCLAAQAGDDPDTADIVYSTSGDPLASGRMVELGPPIGLVRAALVGGTWQAPIGGQYEAMTVTTSRGRLTVIDDRKFLDGAILAAAVAATGGLDGPLPLWKRWQQVLQAAGEVGIVVAERLN